MLAAVLLRRSQSPSFPLVLLPAAALLGACGPSTPAPVSAPVVKVAEEVAPVTTPVPEGYRCEGQSFVAGGAEYCAYPDAVPWLRAKQACAERGGQLASFGSAREHQALLTALGPAIGGAEGLWFGLSEPQKGTWQWQDGTAVGYTHWNRGEPNDDGGDEDCAEWILGTGKWNDAPCFVGRPYVCEAAGAPGPTRCTGTLVQTSAGDYCFHLADADVSDWEDAKSACAAEGATLAILSTREEGDLLHASVGPKLASRSVWVGFNDIAREGSFRWVSGERASFASWKAGEPNDFGDEGEDCAEWFPEDGKMNDLPCSAARPYLCERATK